MRETPTVYEVAARAGVSTASVSRVLAGNDRVRPETRERVLAAVADLGYVPSGAARDLAGGRTGVLGLCFPDLVGDQDIVESDETYWYDEVIRGMERAARRSGFAVLIAATHASDDARVVTLVAGRCDGLAVLAHTVRPETLRRIARRIPVVMLAAQHELGGGWSRDLAIDRLAVANDTGAYELAAHLVDVHGYTDVRFVAGPDSPDSTSRFLGYRRALLERGLSAPEQPELVGDFTTAGGRRVMTELLRQDKPPRAVMCVNDQTAVGALAVLTEAGLRVPEDVAVTGFDGIQLGQHLRPALTTVVQQMRVLGERVVSLLEERIADPALPPRTVELPVRVALRGSCGCAEGHEGATP